MSNSPLTVIVNKSGGTASSLGDKLEGELEAAFSAAGQQIDAQLVEGGDIKRTVEAAKGSPLIAVGGGDGTLGTAAALIAESETALGILPLGTRNHLAKQLGIPPEIEGAAKIIAQGSRVRIDLARCGERVFVNNASMGVYTRLVRERDRHFGPKWLGTIPATFYVLRHLRAKPVRLTIDGKEQQVVTPLLFVGNNRYSLDSGKVGTRESLTDGVLSVFAVAHGSPLSLVGFALRALIGKADPERDFCELTTAREVTVEGTGMLDVAFDGEVERMELPLHFSIMPAALTVMVGDPAEAERTDAS